MTHSEPLNSWFNVTLGNMSFLHKPVSQGILYDIFPFSVEENLLKKFDDWIELFKTGHVDETMGNYTEDAEVYSPNAETMRGREGRDNNYCLSVKKEIDKTSCSHTTSLFQYFNPILIEIRLKIASYDFICKFCK